MTFPQVAAVNGGNNNTDSQNHTVNLPAGIQAGDLLLVFFASDGNPTITFPNGWTQRFNVNNGNAVRFGCWYKIADGSEGSTITVTTSASEKTAHTSYRITGYADTPESATATGVSATPNPPSLSPSWGAKDTLWLAACGYDYNRTVSNYPANYTNGRNDYANSTTGCGVGSARRELNAPSEDPGAFTISVSDDWVAATVAIKPTALMGWLSGWQYRKSHVINAASGAGTNYQQRIKVYYDALPFGYEERTGQFKASDYDSQGNLCIQGRESSAPDKLYKSTDGGNTFSVVYTLPAGGRFNRAVLFIDSQDRIFISASGFTSGNPNRLLRSVNGGETFTEVLAAPIWDIDEDASGNLYACRYPDAAKVYKSTDGGANWTDISSPSWTSGNSDHVHRVRVDPSTGWLYCSIGDKTGTDALSGLWRSKLKDGTDWVRKYGDLPPTQKSIFIGIVFKDSYIYIGDDDEADNGRIYRFQDDGTSNLRVVSDSDLVLNITDGVNRAAFYLEKDDTGRIWATFYPYPSPADGRIYTSENGTTWTFRGSFCHPIVSADEILEFNYMEAGVRHFRGKQESRFAIIGGHIRASFGMQAVNLEGHSRTDFGDVRFTDDDGTTLLDYWIEEKVEEDYAVFWVEVADDLSSQARTIYIYYGKSDATTTSNGNNTFPFFDDFSGDLSKWTILLGTWEIVDGELRSTATDDSILRSATYQVANARVRTKLRLDTASDYWSPAVRFQDATNFYQTGASRSLGSQYFRQYKCVGGSFTKIGTEVIFNPAQTSHTSTVLAYGSSLKAYQDDLYKIEATDSQFSSGYITLKFCSTGQSGTGYVDWVFVGKYVSPEPMHGSWGNEETEGPQLKTVMDSLGLSDAVLRHKPLLSITDVMGLTDAILRNKALTITDSVGAADNVKSDKTLTITDVLALAETIKALKTLVITDQVQLADLVDVIKAGILKSVADSVGLTDSVLRNKFLQVSDSVALLEAASIPSRILQVIDAVVLTDGAFVDKVLVVTESVSLAEIVEVGVDGAKKTKLFLILGDLAVQLTGD